MVDILKECIKMLRRSKNRKSGGNLRHYRASGKEDGMQPDHYTAKKHLQELRKSEFEAFIDEFLFSDAEKEILHKIYVEKLPLWKVGECCGYS